MQSYFIAKKWLYRIVLVLVIMVVTAGVMELNRLVQEITPGKAPVLPSVQPLTKAPAVNLVPETWGKSEKPDKTGRHEFFVEYRLERDRFRSQRVYVLRETVNNQNSAGDIRKEANRELLFIYRNMEKEMELENLIKAEGLKDAVVYLQEKNAIITVQTESLSAAEREKLVSLVTRITGLQAGNIDFICKN